MIRLARAADLIQAQAVVTAAFTPFIAVIGRPPAPMARDLASAIAAGQLYLAGTAPGLGLLLCQPKGDALEVDILAVDPAAQGQGLGRTLMAEAEQIARRQGLAAITLYTNAAMTGAQRLYDGLGFTLIERAHQDGFDRLFYRKNVPQVI